MGRAEAKPNPEVGSRVDEGVRVSLDRNSVFGLLERPRPTVHEVSSMET